jgi:DNA-binding transcriptional regulator YdaS (Cro superfamily)
MQEHPIGRYRRLNRLKIRELAAKVGCTETTISLITLDKRNASPELALAIERATDGAISAHELLSRQMRVTLKRKREASAPAPPDDQVVKAS